MQNYVPNRTCACLRCKWNGLMGPSLFVTFGLLLLIDNLGAPGFNRTWPVVLVVIGAVKVLQTSGSTAGHRTDDGVPAEPAAPVTPAPDVPSLEVSRD